MEQLRCFLKEVLQNSDEECYKSDIYTTVRMSDIADGSTHLEENIHLSENDGNADLPQQNTVQNALEEKDSLTVKLLLNYDDMAKPPFDESADLNDTSENNSRNAVDVIRNSPLASPRMRKGKNLRLKVNLPVLDSSNLGRPLSPVDEHDCTSFPQKETPEASPNTRFGTRPRSRIVMGRSALMKLNEIKENEDSKVVKHLVLDKYSDTLNYFMERRCQRQNSRGSQSTDDYSDSPQSFSSISTSCGTASHFSFDSVDSYNRQDQPTYWNFRPKVSRSIDDVNKDTTLEEFDRTFASSFTPRSDDMNEPVNDWNERTSPKSANTTNISSLLSRRASSFCNFFKKGIRRRMSLSRLERPQEITKQRSSMALNNNEDIKEHFMRDLLIQNEIILQVSKALNICRTSKEFLARSEHIEAERILLLATARKEVLVKEIDHIEFEGETAKDTRSHGVLEISNIVFPVKENTTTISSQEKHEDVLEHFVVLVSCGTIVSSSQVLAVKNGSIAVERNFSFTLHKDFQITIAIYSMTLRNNKNHDSKSHTSKDFVTKTQSPKSIFHLLRETTHKSKATNQVPSIKTSSLLLCGKCHIQSGDLTKRTVFTLHDQKADSCLEGTFIVDIKKDIVLNVRSSGFLTVGIDDGSSCTIWNRRWCLLEGSKLKYWNYPSEEAASPTNEIDLADCATQEVSLAERNLCARPKTLLLVVYDKADAVKRYFLSADTLLEMNHWLDDLNYVITMLRAWNCMNQKEELMTSL